MYGDSQELGFKALIPGVSRPSLHMCDIIIPIVGTEGSGSHYAKGTDCEAIEYAPLEWMHVSGTAIMRGPCHTMMPLTHDLMCSPGA